MELLIDVAACMPCNDRLELIDCLARAAPELVRAVVDNTVWDVRTLIDVMSIEVSMSKAPELGLRERIFARARSIIDARFLPKGQTAQHLRRVAGFLPDLRQVDAPHLREVHIHEPISYVEQPEWDLPPTVHTVAGTPATLLAVARWDRVASLTVKCYKNRSASERLAARLCAPDALPALRRLECEDPTLLSQLDLDALPLLDELSIVCIDLPAQPLRATECVCVKTSQYGFGKISFGPEVKAIRLFGTTEMASVPASCVDLELTGWLRVVADALQTSSVRRLVLTLTLFDEVVHIPRCVGPEVDELWLDLVWPLGVARVGQQRLTVPLAETIFRQAPRLQRIRVGRGLGAEPHPRVTVVPRIPRYDFPDIPA